LGAGLFWVNDEGELGRLSTEDGLTSNYILALEADREGSLWVGTDGGGLNRVKRPRFEVVGSFHGVVQSVCGDDAGDIWIGYNGRGEVDRWSQGAVERVSTGPATPNVSVKAVFADHRQRVWAARWAQWGSGLFQFFGGRFARVAGGPTYGREVC